MKFAGRDGVVYTVAGKGGLVREVLLPHRLAERLEQRRLHVSERVVDRGVRYERRYDVGGGHAFSTSFSRASIEALGRSRGATDCATPTPKRGCRNSCTTPTTPWRSASSQRKWGTFAPTSLRPICDSLRHHRSASPVANSPWVSLQWWALQSATRLFKSWMSCPAAAASA